MEVRAILGLKIETGCADWEISRRGNIVSNFKRQSFRELICRTESSVGGNL